MTFKLDVKKSDRIKRYYLCDLDTFNGIFRPNLKHNESRDFPLAREYVLNALKVDQNQFRRIVEPYSHCDEVRIIFTQKDGEIKAGQPRTGISLSPRVFDKKSGKFFYLEGDHFPYKNGGSKDCYVTIESFLLFEKNKHQNGVIRTHILKEKDYVSEQEVSKQTKVWGKVLTDLRKITRNEKGRSVVFINSSTLFPGNPTGEKLYLNLSQIEDLPWMILNSRELLEQLAENPEFQEMVSMKETILNVNGIISNNEKGENENFRLLYDSIGNVTKIIETSSFSKKVKSKSKTINEAVNTLNESLENQLIAAELEYQKKREDFQRTGSLELRRFLQNI